MRGGINGDWRFRGTRNFGLDVRRFWHTFLVGVETILAAGLSALHFCSFQLICTQSLLLLRYWRNFLFQIYFIAHSSG